jgi:hypothetical protein
MPKVSASQSRFVKRKDAEEARAEAKAEEEMRLKAEEEAKRR